MTPPTNNNKNNYYGMRMPIEFTIVTKDSKILVLFHIMALI